MADRTEWWDAPEVAKIAAKLIKEHHPDLASQQIVYVFKSKASRQGGRTILAKARKIGGLNAYLADRGVEELLVVEVAKDMWALLNGAQRIALIDHELCHFRMNEETGVVAIVGHQVEEFVDIVERHGLWQTDLGNMIKAGADQLDLFISEGDNVTSISG